MNTKKLTLKDTFVVALNNYKEKKFSVAEDLCNKILSIDSDHFDSLALLSNMYALKKNYKKAKDLMIRADKIKPNNLSVLNNLGTACKELGDNKGAIGYYEKIIKINPNHTNAQYNLGIMFYNLREYKKAKNFFQKTTEIQPNYALAFISLANVSFELKDYTNAIKNYQRAIEINPNIVSAHNNLGLVFRVLNDYENAIKCYEKAIKINKNNAGTYHNLALAQKEIGKFTEAIKSHEIAIKYEPDNLTHYFYLSELKKDIVDTNLRDKIKKITNDRNSTKLNIAYGNYLLAKYERENKNYEKELNHLEKGHQKYFESKKDKFNLGVKYCFEDVLQISTGAKVEKLSKKTDSNLKPIFIVGVPRCGSTLVEKIIASGSKFVPIGEETTVLENFINKKILEKQSLNLGKVTDVRNELSEIYKQKGLVYEKYDNVFTDKSLNNFFYLELIKDIFPNAKIINCNRDLLSSIMSIYQNNITELAWVHNLDNIFKYFDNYLDIIENFEKNNPNIIYELQLEKLINNPEEESKKIMEYCELPWDKKCLEFYKRKDLISKTASNIQIRGAINKDNLKKYLPYKEYLNKYQKSYPWFK